MTEKTLLSPDGRSQLTVSFSDTGEVTYAFIFNSKTVILPSKLGLRLQNQPDFDRNFTLLRTFQRQKDEIWENPLGEARENRNCYREIAFYLTETAGAHRILTLRFRVFDDGLAFRYEIPAQPTLDPMSTAIADELTEFNFEPGAQIWQIPAYQKDRYEYIHRKVTLADLNHPVHTPATLELTSGLTVALHEAALYDYGAMTLRHDPSRSGNLTTDITPRSDGLKAVVALPFATPWRCVLTGGNPLALVTNRMILNLNDPPRGDFSWVKPLKFMGIWWALIMDEWTWAPGPRHGATTAHAENYLDFCAANGIGGLLIEGWNNGWEGDWLQNGATTDFTRPQPDFDLPAIATYAQEKHVELIGHHETVGFVDNYERQLEAAYAYYTEHGIHYIKPGYANARMRINGREEFHHCQLGVRHYQKALELAAKYRICLDVHEPIKGTGTERTWPNLLTREGARGQEYAGGELPPEHMCSLPFTRLLAGGFDNTPGIFDLPGSRRRLDSTLARQLAYYTIVYSGMQMLADRPKFYAHDFSDEKLGSLESPERQALFTNAKFTEAFEFLKQVPVIWEQTRPLAGKIGEFYAVARQERGERGDWWLGAVTDANARELSLPFDFLDADAEYELTLYRDAPEAHYQTNPLPMEIETRDLRHSDTLSVRLAPGGGCAGHIRRK